MLRETLIVSRIAAGIHDPSQRAIDTPAAREDGEPLAPLRQETVLRVVLASSKTRLVGLYKLLELLLLKRHSHSITASSGSKFPHDTGSRARPGPPRTASAATTSSGAVKNFTSLLTWA